MVARVAVFFLRDQVLSFLSEVLFENTFSSYCLSSTHPKLPAWESLMLSKHIRMSKVFFSVSIVVHKRFISETYKSITFIFNCFKLIGYCELTNLLHTLIKNLTFLTFMLSEHQSLRSDVTQNFIYLFFSTLIFLVLGSMAPMESDSDEIEKFNGEINNNQQEKSWQDHKKSK